MPQLRYFLGQGWYQKGAARADAHDSPPLPRALAVRYDQARHRRAGGSVLVEADRRAGAPVASCPSPLAPRPSHPSLDALLALDQNFVAAIEFPKKSEKKIYGECKARFEGCRRIVDLYVAKAGADAISSPYEHFLESMRTSYDVARTKALRALISKTPASSFSLTEPALPDAAAPDHDAVQSVAALTEVPNADPEPPSASCPQPDYLFGVEGIYDVSHASVACLRAHFERFASGDGVDGLDMPMGAACVRAFFEWVQARQPPPEVRYPLDPDTRYMLEVSRWMVAAPLPFPSPTPNPLPTPRIPSPHEPLTRPLQCIVTAGNARKHEASIYTSSKAHLVRDQKAVEAHNRFLVEQSKRPRLMASAGQDV